MSMLLFDEFFQMIVKLVTRFALCTKNAYKKLVKLRYVNIFLFLMNQDDIINVYHQDTKFHDPPDNLF